MIRSPCSVREFTSMMPLPLEGKKLASAPKVDLGDPYAESGQT